MGTITDDDEVVIPFVALNKNFCNYPLARDIRSRDWHWLRDPTTRRWHGNVYDAHKRNPRLELRFASDVDLACRRAPTGFEVNMLGLIMATAQRRNNASVTFNAQAEMLRALDHGIDTRNRELLQRALEFWQEITLRFGQWFRAGPQQQAAMAAWARLAADVSGQGQTDGAGVAAARAFVCAQARRAGGGASPNPDWLKLHDAFFEKLPLPLPHDAASQNLVLAVLVSIKDRESHQGVQDKSVIYARPRGYRQFCKTIGLNHSRRGQVLQRALVGGQDWFARNGGSLEYAIDDDDLIFFTIHKPRRHWLPRATEPQQPRRAKKRRRPRVPFAVSELMFADQEQPEMVEARDEEGRLIWSAEDLQKNANRRNTSG